jgi:hypothetical protein
MSNDDVLCSSKALFKCNAESPDSLGDIILRCCCEGCAKVHVLLNKMRAISNKPTSLTNQNIFIDAWEKYFIFNLTERGSLCFRMFMPINCEPNLKSISPLSGNSQSLSPTNMPAAGGSQVMISAGRYSSQAASRTLRRRVYSRRRCMSHRK